MIFTILEILVSFVAASLMWVVYCACVLSSRYSREEEAKALKGDSNDLS